MKAQKTNKVCPFMTGGTWVTTCLKKRCELWDATAQTCSVKVLVRLLRKAEK